MRFFTSFRMTQRRIRNDNTLYYDTGPGGEEVKKVPLPTVGEVYPPLAAPKATRG
jgi:hypothetical protein